MRQKNCPCLLWKIITSKNYFPCLLLARATTICKENTKEKMTIGAKIDIFPIDNVPDDEQEWKEYDTDRRKKQFFLNRYFLKCSKKRSFSMNVKLVVFHIFTLFFSVRKFAERLDKLSQKYDNQETKYVFSNSQGLFVKKRFLKKVFDKVVDLPFEDREFKGFSEYDEYLSNAYGDYMKLPPVEKRVSTHTFKAYWK